MLRYETLFLTTPEITQDEATTLEKQMEAALKEHKASLVSFERWGKYRLAFPVRNNDYGVYFLARFEVNSESARTLLEQMSSLFRVKLNEVIMRHLVHKLNPKAPLSYHRPESLEEAPTRDVETFLKESKMTGLLGKKAYEKSGGRSHERYQEKESTSAAEGE